MQQQPDITVVGLGPAGLSLLSAEALAALEAAPKLILRTERHPAAAELRARGVRFTSLDRIYESAPSFEELYPALADAVLREAAAGPVVYAVPGHPLIGEASVRILLAAAAEAELSTRVIPAPAFVDVVVTALAAAGEVPAFTEWQVADAAALERVWWDPGRPALIFQIDDGAIASRVKLALLDEYPHDFPVWLVRHAGDPAQERTTRLPLYRLDRPEAGPYDHLTTLYLPALPEDRRRPGFRELTDVVAALRGPRGCPWDREQNFASLKRYVLEEAYEVLEAVDAGDPARLCDELGDLLLLVVMYAQLGSEEGAFTIRDVLEHIVEKLVRRHPHVFGDAAAETADEVLRNWEAIKNRERPERTSVLDGVPKELPALLKALEISKRVVRVGFEWPDLPSVLQKLDEEVAELKAELPGADREKLTAEIGDLLFTVVNVARWLKIDPEEALRRMLDRFGRRFREMERLAALRGEPLAGMGIQRLDALWEEAKANEAAARRNGAASDEGNRDA